MLSIDLPTPSPKPAPQASWNEEAIIAEVISYEDPGSYALACFNTLSVKLTNLYAKLHDASFVLAKNDLEQEERQKISLTVTQCGEEITALLEESKKWQEIMTRLQSCSECFPEWKNMKPQEKREAMEGVSAFMEAKQEASTEFKKITRLTEEEIKDYKPAVWHLNDMGNHLIGNENNVEETISLITRIAGSEASGKDADNNGGLDDMERNGFNVNYTYQGDFVSGAISLELSMATGVPLIDISQHFHIHYMEVDALSRLQKASLSAVKNQFLSTAQEKEAFLKKEHGSLHNEKLAIIAALHAGKPVFIPSNNNSHWVLHALVPSIDEKGGKYIKHIVRDSLGPGSNGTLGQQNIDIISDWINDDLNLDVKRENLSVNQQISNSCGPSVITNAVSIGAYVHNKRSQVQGADEWCGWDSSEFRLMDTAYRTQGQDFDSMTNRLRDEVRILKEHISDGSSADKIIEELRNKALVLHLLQSLHKKVAQKTPKLGMEVVIKEEVLNAMLQAEKPNYALNDPGLSAEGNIANVERYLLKVVLKPLSKGGAADLYRDFNDSPMKIEGVWRQLKFSSSNDLETYIRYLIMHDKIYVPDKGDKAIVKMYVEFYKNMVTEAKKLESLENTAEVINHGIATYVAKVNEDVHTLIYNNKKVQSLLLCYAGKNNDRSVQVARIVDILLERADPKNRANQGFMRLLKAEAENILDNTHEFIGDQESKREFQPVTQLGFLSKAPGDNLIYQLHTKLYQIVQYKQHIQGLTKEHPCAKNWREIVLTARRAIHTGANYAGIIHRLDRCLELCQALEADSKITDVKDHGLIRRCGARSESITRIVHDIEEEAIKRSWFYYGRLPLILLGTAASFSVGHFIAAFAYNLKDKFTVGKEAAFIKAYKNLHALVQHKLPVIAPKPNAVIPDNLIPITTVATDATAATVNAATDTVVDTLTPPIVPPVVPEIPLSVITKSAIIPVVTGSICGVLALIGLLWITRSKKVENPTQLIQHSLDADVDGIDLFKGIWPDLTPVKNVAPKPITAAATTAAGEHGTTTTDEPDLTKPERFNRDLNGPRIIRRGSFADQANNTAKDRPTKDDLDLTETDKNDLRAQFALKRKQKPEGRGANK